MQQSHNWQEIEESLFRAGKAALLQFAAQHPEEICSFFAYAFTITRRGREFLLCFDTWSNAIHQARENEQKIIEQRKDMLGGDFSEDFGWPWECARYVPTMEHIVDYTPTIRFFAYSLSTEVLIEERIWVYEELDGNTRLVLWKVLERLLADDSFAHLRLSSPFRVGYQFDTEDIVVVRMLNWPKVEEPQGKAN